jgi:hypothetical protein
MELKEFKNSVNILTGEEAQLIRELFRDTFVDKNKESYKKYIESTIMCSGGNCYSGYLWDVFKHSKRIGEGLAKAHVSDRNIIYVMWGIHSKEGMPKKDNWRLPKEAILHVESSLLLDQLSHLPEDIYIFDDSFSWAVALTNEWGGRPDKRWCLHAAAN